MESAEEFFQVLREAKRKWPMQFRLASNLRECTIEVTEKTEKGQKTIVKRTAESTDECFEVAAMNLREYLRIFKEDKENV